MVILLGEYRMSIFMSLYNELPLRRLRNPKFKMKKDLQTSRRQKHLNAVYNSPDTKPTNYRYLFIRKITGGTSVGTLCRVMVSVPCSSV
ncbi:hypothetical protein GWI33_021729 [Rhynchophorus ferrugineus]|uniref:Uncharacterized protein n=1 Tax=Rhynchophorus ferrugineus TaxID=354439 RepID=A0A834IR06_RHYFE|nr:hypothetical protein GWI33_021729 [Rhynchophorus ferrugineus]